MSCCAVGCLNRNRRKDGLHFYRIPSSRKPFEAKRRSLWLQAIKRTDWTDEIIGNSRLCSAHFISGKASMDPESPDFVPSLFTYSKQSQCMEARTKLHRFNRKRKWAESICKSSLADTSNRLRAASGSSTREPTTDYEPPECKEEICSNEEDAMIPRAIFSELQVQHNQLLRECDNLRTKCNALKEENEQLKEALGSRRFSFSSIRKNARHFLFFTGLTTIVFEWLLSKLKDSVAVTNRVLSLEDHLLVVLTKLRLGASNTDIAFRFNVTDTVISNILRNWLPIMARTLKPIITWPSRKAILRKMPRCFKKKYRQCRCIIDCAEIFIDRPDNPTARAQTWSNYKHHNTVKYLVGVTPAGAISFLSPGWGGRVSDKEITTKSGFFQLLEPNDVILADHGFLIREDLAAYGATLYIPHFTKGKKRLAAHEVDTSRRLSSLRIHVERVIGRWKQFKILTSVIPLTQEVELMPAGPGRLFSAIPCRDQGTP
ncbi:uncharacterized protein LOC130557658 isoform X3 [Triplophysa rosa]|uniref:uncharacterized protein LOC130557658 isoform X3 n=1 Tax=Triplophysa rosa TaxID=992332 RepID=UPI0025462695|nr:uncharacterized protein LOC130557658 isoform X3 [Triplophysa rosa]